MEQPARTKVHNRHTKKTKTHRSLHKHYLFVVNTAILHYSFGSSLPAAFLDSWWYGENFLRCCGLLLLFYETITKNNASGTASRRLGGPYFWKDVRGRLTQANIIAFFLSGAGGPLLQGRYQLVFTLVSISVFLDPSACKLVSCFAGACRIGRSPKCHPSNIHSRMSRAISTATTRATNRLCSRSRATRASLVHKIVR